ncbi:MAG: hypothetical protein ACYTF0_04110 [Planctomycetota bacterium]|jgi:hypothetical protein
MDHRPVLPALLCLCLNALPAESATEAALARLTAEEGLVYDGYLTRLRLAAGMRIFTDSAWDDFGAGELPAIALAYQTRQRDWPIAVDFGLSYASGDGMVSEYSVGDFHLGVARTWDNGLGPRAELGAGLIVTWADIDAGRPLANDLSDESLTSAGLYLDGEVGYVVSPSIDTGLRLRFSHASADSAILGDGVDLGGISLAATLALRL